jgi:uncharacterized protein YuzE
MQRPFPSPSHQIPPLDADIAWLPTGESDDVVGERVPHGVHDLDRTSRQLVAIEIWAASAQLPPAILEALPSPTGPAVSGSGGP